jgi:predicted hydrocarbon binding protein
MQAKSRLKPARKQKQQKKIVKRRVTVKKIKKRPVKMEEKYPATYEEMLLSNILNSKNKEKITEDAMLFNALLSNLTTSLNAMHKKSGAYAGRHLYILLSNKKDYLWYEETVSDLVKFLEKAGYPSVTYNVFPDKVRLQIHDKSHEHLGMNMHSFESGLISGYLTAGKKEYVRIDELQCSNNRSSHCDFTSSYVELPQYDQEHARNAINVFIRHIINQVNSKEKASSLRISPEYYLLSLSTMLNVSYTKEMQSIAFYIGSEISEGIAKSTGKNAIVKINKVISLLNLGKPNLKSLKPIKMDISFDRLHSKSEFVDISVALANGLLQRYVKNSINMTKEARNGAYKISIMEKIPKSK